MNNSTEHKPHLEPGAVTKAAMTHAELYESGEALVSKGEAYFGALDFRYAYESLFEQFEAYRIGLRDLLDVAERTRGGDPSLDPEEWYAIRDYCKNLPGLRDSIPAKEPFDQRPPRRAHWQVVPSKEA